MSQRRNDFDGNAAFGCLALIGLMLYKLFRVPPQEKLLKLNKSTLWGQELEAIECPNCQMYCDPLETDCFNCGSNFTKMIKSEPKTKKPLIGQTEKLTFLALIGIFTFFGFLAYLIELVMWIF